jgi:hypothetical protein
MGGRWQSSQLETINMDTPVLTGGDSPPLWNVYRLQRYIIPRNRFEEALFIHRPAT